jgi:hypothetical protein
MSTAAQFDPVTGKLVTAASPTNPAFGAFDDSEFDFAKLLSETNYER